MVIFFQSEKKTTAQTHGNMAENSAKKIPIQRLIWLSNEREKERQKENWKKLATSSSSSAASLFKNFLKKNEQKIFFLETNKQKNENFFHLNQWKKKKTMKTTGEFQYRSSAKTKQNKLNILSSSTMEQNTVTTRKKVLLTYLLWKKERKTIKETKKNM